MKPEEPKPDQPVQDQSTELVKKHPAAGRMKGTKGIVGCSEHNKKAKAHAKQEVADGILSIWTRDRSVERSRYAQHGRPSKLTVEVTKTLYDAFAIGMPVNLACGLVGITSGSYSNWMQDGETGNNPDTKAFYEAINHAKAIFMQKHLKNIEDHAFGKKKQADGWVIASVIALERRLPQYFGKTRPTKKIDEADRAQNNSIRDAALEATAHASYSRVTVIEATTDPSKMIIDQSVPKSLEPPKEPEDQV